MVCDCSYGRKLLFSEIYKLFSKLISLVRKNSYKLNNA